MTDPKVLADALVEAGIGFICQYPDDDLSEYRYQLPNESRWWTADKFITDWRVAGKVLESMTWAELRELMFDKLLMHRGGVTEAHDKITCRAIIEAWYEATEQGESDERSRHHQGDCR